MIATQSVVKIGGGLQHYVTVTFWDLGVIFYII